MHSPQPQNIVTIYDLYLKFNTQNGKKLFLLRFSLMWFQFEVVLFYFKFLPNQFRLIMGHSSISDVFLASICLEIFISFPMHTFFSRSD